MHDPRVTFTRGDVERCQPLAIALVDDERSFIRVEQLASGVIAAVSVIMKILLNYMFKFFTVLGPASTDYGWFADKSVYNTRVLKKSKYTLCKKQISEILRDTKNILGDYNVFGSNEVEKRKQEGVPCIGYAKNRIIDRSKYLFKVC